MMLDPVSVGVGVAIAAAIAQAWLFGRQSAIRECRRIARHGRALDLVFYEDAERDPTIKRPEPVSADVAPWHHSQK